LKSLFSNICIRISSIRISNIRRQIFEHPNTFKYSPYTGACQCTQTASCIVRQAYARISSLKICNRQKDKQTEGQTDRRTNRLEDKQTEGQTDRWTDRQKDRQTEGQIDGKTNRLKEKTYRRTNKQKDKITEGQTDRRTNRPKDKQTDRQNNRKTRPDICLLCNISIYIYIYIYMRIIVLNHISLLCIKLHIAR
jgi:hypothetical protein